MSTRATTIEVTGFLAGVRAALDDLDGAERDELLGGLEADLQEAYDQALADSGTAPDWFGDPAAYAAELRASAGIPPRGPAPSGPMEPEQRRAPAVELKRQSLAVRDNLRSRSWWPWASSFGQALEPVWWVGRAWALCALLAVVSGMDVGLIPGTGLLGVLVFAAALVASVQVGRGLWRLPESWGPAAKVGVNVVGGLVVAFVALVAVVGGVGGGWSGPQHAPQLDPSSHGLGDGVWVRGEPATNLFVYGPDGKLIDGAQIVDQAGRPVLLAPDGEALYPEEGGIVVLSPRKNAYGADVPNAYPMPQHREVTEWDDEGSETTVQTPYNNHPPMIAVPPLADSSSTASPSPTASPSSTASPSPTAGPAPKEGPSASSSD